MLWIVITILFVCWVLGFFVYHVLGNTIHIVLLIAVILMLVDLLRAKSPRA